MKKAPLIIFLASISLFALLFYLERHFMTSMDEYEQLVSGWLISEGRHPYKDFFSNHLPLPGYYSSIFAYFYKNVSNVTAMTIFRLSLLLLYLGNFLSLYIFSKNNKTKIALAVFIASLSIWLPVYHGNLLFSDTFFAVFLMSLTWIIIPCLLKWEKLTTPKYLYLGIMSSFISWTTTVPPTPFFLISILILKDNSIKTGRKKTLFLLTLFFYAFPALLFLLNNQLKNLLEQVFYQNIVYSTLTFPEKMENTPFIFQQIIKFFENQLYLFTHLSNPFEIFQFLLNTTVTLYGIFLLLKKRYFHFIVFLLLFLTARSREFKIIVGKPFSFSFYPYLCFASAILVLIAVKAFLKDNLKKFLTLVLLISYFLVSFIQAKPIIVQSLKPGYNFHVFFQDRVSEGELIKKMTRPDEKILVFPNDIDIYFYARRFPEDFFTFYFPWIDAMDKYRIIRQETIKNKNFSVLYVGDISTSPKDIPFYSKYKEELIKGFINLKQPNGNSSHIYIREDQKERLRTAF